MKKLQFVLLTLMLGWTAMAYAESFHTAGKEIVMDEFDTVPKAFDSIKATLKEQGLEYIGVIDHAANAEEIGLSLPATKLILYRDHRQKNRLLPRNPLLAIDLPQKILLWEDVDSEEVKMLYNPGVYLVERHNIKILSQPNSQNQKPKSDGLITVQSTYSQEETVDNLKAVLESNNFSIPFTFTIAHKGNEGKVAQVIIFSNPEVGTPLMQKQHAIGLDLPQKFLVWEDQNNQVHVTYNDPAYFGKRHGRQGLSSMLAKMSIQLNEMASEGAGNALADLANQQYYFASAVPVQRANRTGPIMLTPMVVNPDPVLTPTVNPYSYIINHLVGGPTSVPGLNTNFQSNGNGISTNSTNSSTAKTPEEILSSAKGRVQDKADRAAKKAQEKASKAQRKADEKKEDFRQAQLKEKQIRQELATATGRLQRRLQKGVAKAQRKVSRALKNANKYQSLANQAKQQASYLQQRADKGIDRNLVQGVGQYAIDTGKDLSKAIGAGFELLRNPKMLSSFLQAIEETSEALQDPARRAEVIQLITEALGAGVIGAIDNFAQDKDYYTGYIAAAIFDPLGKIGKLGELFDSVRGIKRIGVKNVFNIDSKQLGKKLGKHVEDFGGNPSSAVDRKRVIDRINDIANNPEKIVSGTFKGQGKNNTRGPVDFRIKGNDVVVTKPDGSFVTVLKDGINNTSVKNALGAKS